jgi:hypothetical protein
MPEFDKAALTIPGIRDMKIFFSASDDITRNKLASMPIPEIWGGAGK